MKNTDPPTLSEEAAVEAFARAWNRLEPEVFLRLLAEDARYASQWVFEELVGAQAISHYLREKMRTVKAHALNHPEARVRVETGSLSPRAGSRPVAWMTQGNSGQVQAAVLFEVAENRIQRYDLCLPELMGAVRTGIYPS